MLFGLSIFDRFAESAEKHKFRLLGASLAALCAIAALDRVMALNCGLGFLYLLPVAAASLVLGGMEIVGLATACSLLIEAQAPFSGEPGGTGRLLLANAGLSFAGLLVSDLARKRRLAAARAADLQAEVSLHVLTEQQLRVVVDASPLALLLVAANGNIAMANDNAGRLFGVTGSLTGRSIGDFLPALQRMVRKLDGAERRSVVECRGTLDDGQEFMAQVWCGACSVDRQPLLSVAVWDSTDTMRHREEANAEAFVRVARSVFNGVSHEIRMLTAAASAACGGLAGYTEPAPPSELRLLGGVMSALENVSSASLRLPADTSGASADIAGLLCDVRLVLQPMLREAGIQLDIREVGTLPPVAADPSLLLQILVHLGMNALRAMGRGGSFRITAKSEGSRVEIRCSDTGPGVSKPEQLFRPFVRTDSSTGLGLFSSRSLLRAWNGDLHHEPSDFGACFVISLHPVPVEKYVALYA